MRPFRRLAAASLALPLLAACAGVRPPEEPAPAAPETAPAPPQETAGHELSTPIEDREAGALEEETREAIRETEEHLDGLDAEARESRRESVATVRGLLEQSRSALAEGDLPRAHNLARKARELAGAL